MLKKRSIYLKGSIDQDLSNESTDIEICCQYCRKLKIHKSRRSKKSQT